MRPADLAQSARKRHQAVRDALFLLPGRGHLAKRGVVDCFKLPKPPHADAAGYCFVAVDRATRLVWRCAYLDKTKDSATDFLRRCLEFFPFTIEKLLTDNGREFTLAGFKNRWGTKLKTHHHPSLRAIMQRQLDPASPHQAA